MATNHTENYQLNLWEPGDSFLRTDFNADNAKLDAALAAHDTQLATIPKIATGTYVGTGSQGQKTPNTLTLPFEAKLLFIIGGSHNSSSGFFLRGCPNCTVNWYGGSCSNVEAPVTWDGCTVSWYTVEPTLDGTQMNKQGVTYYYLAIG